ncbi:DUF6221 family protein [Streptomyces griseorubiginosus]|uniref:DUF6221 family protein n=1 Tax=Streptomyces griseorubiginosus TaxID=67304 RepID=UPI0033255C40
MDLHAWITQQVDRVEKLARACDATDWRHVFDGVIVDRDTDGWQSAPDSARIASIAYERIYWSTNPPHSPEADHIVTHDPDTILRRCEADRRILARHAPQPNGTGFDDGWQCQTCSQDGGDGYQYLVPYPCPTVEDLAHAHGITPDVLAGLDHPRPQPPEPGLHPDAAYKMRITATPPITTSDVPEALRGPRSKP